jgi:hypothetical protein
VGHVQLEFLAELAVIALLGLGQVLEQVLIEFFLGEEAVAVDALHRGVLGVALPVRGRGRGVELEGLDVRRARQMRAKAEVDEGPHGVALDDLAGLLFDELALQGLAFFREDRLSASSLGRSFFSMGRFCLTMCAIFFLDGESDLQA